MRFPGTPAALAPALAAGALAAAVVVGVAAGVWTPPPAAAPVTNASVERACPAAVGDTATTRLTAWASGGVRTAPLADPAAATERTEVAWDAADTVTRVLTAADDPAAVAASAWAGDGPDRGLSALLCPAALGDAWFVGVRSDASHTAELALTNLDSTPAEVSLTILGTDGRVTAAGLRGIQVGARATRRIALGPLLDSGEPAAVRVETTAGRVAGVLRERAWEGTAARGGLWVGAAAAPATTAVVPGVPGGAGARTLVVTNPGDRVAEVRVDILGDSGAIQIAGAESIDLPGHTTRTLELAPGLGGHAGSVRLTATRDVLAAVRVASTDDAASADAEVIPAAAGFGATAVARIASPQGSGSVLVLANPTDAAATVRVRATGPDGDTRRDEETVVPAGGSIEISGVAGTDTLWQVETDAPGVVGAVAAAAPVGGVTGWAVVPVAARAASASGPTPTPDPHTGS